MNSVELSHATGLILPSSDGRLEAERGLRAQGDGPGVPHVLPTSFPSTRLRQSSGDRGGRRADGSCPWAPGLVLGQGSGPCSRYTDTFLVQTRDLCSDPSGSSQTSTGHWALSRRWLSGCKRYSDTCGLGLCCNQRELMSGALKFPKIREMVSGPVCISQS